MPFQMKRKALSLDDMEGDWQPVRSAILATARLLVFLTYFLVICCIARFNVHMLHMLILCGV